MGDHVLDPGFTDYTKRALYITYDVTNLLKPGRNAIGAVLGAGWYDTPAVDVWNFTSHHGSPAQTLIATRRGIRRRHATIGVSDDTWKTTHGPIVFNSIRAANLRRATRENGWNTAGYDDSRWSQARIMPAPLGRLVGHNRIQPSE